MLDWIDNMDNGATNRVANVLGDSSTAGGRCYESYENCLARVSQGVYP
jgi:hypothetical protein